MKAMSLKDVGPIARAELSFGDLTVLVGPQATGKSITLEFLKLLLDKGQVHQQLTRYGIDWSGDVNRFIDAYFGEGMHAIWGRTSAIEREGKAITMKQLVRRSKPAGAESVFMIPAQRVLALRNGWPRPFADYAPGDPFAVRDFSEKLRVLAEQEFGAAGILFPQKGRLKKEIRDLLIEHVFGGFSLRIDKVASQKRLVLEHGAEPLPHMVWSAGQREFVPLLLAVRCRTPIRPGVRRRAGLAALDEPNRLTRARGVGIWRSGPPRRAGGVRRRRPPPARRPPSLWGSRSPSFSAAGAPG